MQTQSKYHRPMKECRECGELFPSKDNKHFCNTKCKNTYNNREQRERNAYLKPKNKVLRQNFSILRKLLESNVFSIDEIPKTLLLYEGFDFTVFTGVSKQKGGRETITWVYSLGIVPNKGGESFTLCFWKVDGEES